MKIAHIIDSWHGLYGAEMMLLNLMEEQRRMGDSPILISLGSPMEGEKPIEREARRRGIATHPLKIPKGMSFKGALEIVRVSREAGANLLHSHGYKSDILLGLLPGRLRVLPVISTMHGWIAVRRFSKMWFYMLLNKLLLRRLDGVVRVNTLPWKGLDALLFRGTRQFAVENGLAPLPEDLTCRDTSRDLRVELFCKKGFIIGAIGRLSPEKGFSCLINALEILIKTDNNFRVIIIGEGKSRPQLEEMIGVKRLSNHMMLPGYLENASRYLDLFNMIVLPSLTEGLPITLLEAMQSGVAVIATPVGGIPSVLENGKYGVLVEPQNPEKLAEAIQAVKHNTTETKKRTAMAKEMVNIKYSGKRMAEEYTKIYNSILKT